MIRMVPDHEVVRRTQGEMNFETALELRSNYGTQPRSSNSQAS